MPHFYRPRMSLINLIYHSSYRFYGQLSTLPKKPIIGTMHEAEMTRKGIFPYLDRDKMGDRRFESSEGRILPLSPRCQCGLTPPPSLKNLIKG